MLCLPANERISLFSYEDLAVSIFFCIEPSSSESLSSSFVVGFLEILILRGCGHLERCLKFRSESAGILIFSEPYFRFEAVHSSEDYVLEI